MKLHFLITAAAALLVAFPLRVSECRALDGPDRRPSLSSHYANALDEGEDQMRERPFWARLGEEYFIRLGSRNEREGESVPETRPEPASAVFKRALQLRLTRHLLRGHEDEVAEAARGLREVPAERPRRAEEPPISLDLTFHLLREVLEMAKAEQLAQQAHSNRKMMEIFGK